MFRQIVNNDIEEPYVYLLNDSAQMDLPFVVTGVGAFTANANYYVERKQIKDMFLVLYTLSGSGIVANAKTSITLEAGHATILDINEYHLYHTAPGVEKWQFKWVRFCSNYGKLYEQMIYRGKLRPVFVEDLNFEKYFGQIMVAMQDVEQHREVMLSLYVDKILFALYRGGEKYEDEFMSEDEENLEICRKNIIQNSAKKVSLQDLADSCYMTKGAFIRKFKKHYYTTPYSYLMKTRINNAIVLLETTNMSIGDIALEAGFGDQKNFAKQFHIHKGMAPTEYRNQFRK